MTLHFVPPSSDYDPTKPVGYLTLEDENGDPWVVTVDSSGTLATTEPLMTEGVDVLETEAGDPMMVE